MVMNITIRRDCPPVEYQSFEKFGSAVAVSFKADLIQVTLKRRTMHAVFTNLRRKVRKTTLPSMESIDWCFSNSADLFIKYVKK